MRQALGSVPNTSSCFLGDLECIVYMSVPLIHICKARHSLNLPVLCQVIVLFNGGYHSESIRYSVCTL